MDFVSFVLPFFMVVVGGDCGGGVQDSFLGVNTILSSP